MPYVKRGRRMELRTEPRRAQTDGDYNFLFTRAFVSYFVQEPSYSRIATIAKSVHQPNRIEAVEAVDNLLTVQGATTMERQVARELAFAEFYRRIGSRYEDQCIVANGDLAEYEQALLAIQNRFGAAIPKENIG